MNWEILQWFAYGLSLTRQCFTGKRSSLIIIKMSFIFLVFFIFSAHITTAKKNGMYLTGFPYLILCAILKFDL